MTSKTKTKPWLNLLIKFQLCLTEDKIYIGRHNLAHLEGIKPSCLHELESMPLEGKNALKNVGT